MRQSRRASLVESLANIAIGAGVALISQLVFFPFFSINIPLEDNLLITLIFTVISVIRSYAVRRLFESLRIRGIMP